MKKKTSIKTRKLIVFLRRNNIWIFLIVSTVVLLLPILFTLRLTGAPDFTATGAIGDTIGGITAPFVNIGAAFLLFYTLMEQVKSNKKQQRDFILQKKKDRRRKIYEWFLHDLENIYEEIKNFEDITDTRGLNAIFNTCERFERQKNNKDVLIRMTDSEPFRRLHYIVVTINELVKLAKPSELLKSEKNTLLRKVSYLYNGKLYPHVKKVVSAYEGKDIISDRVTFFLKFHNNITETLAEAFRETEGFSRIDD